LQLSLTAGEELEIEYEVDGWFYVSIHEWLKLKKGKLLFEPFLLAVIS
jgi:hypothetical protein